MPLVLAVLLALAPAMSARERPAPASTLRVYLVRHGQAFSNLDPAPELPPDQLDRLTPLGLKQAEAVGRALTGRRPAFVLSSPAGRARETAQAIRAALGGGVPWRVEPRLRPLEPGRSSGGGPMEWDQRIAEWKAGRDPAPSGGESLGQLGRRVLDLVQDEHEREAGRCVVLVAHSEVIGAFLAAVRGDPGPRAYPFSVRNGSVSLVEVRADGRPALVFVNRLPDELP